MSSLVNGVIDQTLRYFIKSDANSYTALCVITTCSNGVVGNLVFEGLNEGRVDGSDITLGRFRIRFENDFLVERDSKGVIDGKPLGIKIVFARRHLGLYWNTISSAVNNNPSEISVATYFQDSVSSHCNSTQPGQQPVVRSLAKKVIFDPCFAGVIVFLKLLRVFYELDRLCEVGLLKKWSLGEVNDNKSSITISYFQNPESQGQSHDVVFELLDLRSDSKMLRMCTEGGFRIDKTADGKLIEPVNVTHAQNFRIDLVIMIKEFDRNFYGKTDLYNIIRNNKFFPKKSRCMLESLDALCDRLALID
jgi:hypothetical protein